MREVESSYIQFPVAIEMPDELARPAVSAWLADRGLEYNRDYICVFGRPLRTKASTRVSAIAFKTKDDALLFKLALAGTYRTPAR